ncbi:MAG: TatD family hydrolase [Thiotrichales bacterium]|nr:TatD family hydrolase [Thiotrichales bacterium]MBT3614057.1 TatD family hydrolase [Thiotrichales bacterium]MBT3753287.1 TatD family hydrolase [Thiotrichales bacterium]MBT3836744.1 TatD family hydrolase [Thiotrichales bacterium]MBT4151496.1 TatD family hydrolase [Thiotrichales bacterium]
MMIDSHCHLDRLNSVDDALKLAEEEGVSGFLNVCIDLDNFDKVLAIAEAHSNIVASVGVHPNDVGESETDIRELLSLADNSKVVAIGETGLDYHYTIEALQYQQQSFRTHIQAAKECGKPLIVHTREAREDTIKILQEEGAEECGGLLHCFTENLAMAQQALELGFYISFSGIITFNSAKELQEIVKEIPEDRILVETDAPYLAPVPFRGRPNQPAYVKQVAEKMAELRGVSLAEIDTITTDNFNRLFGSI